MTREDIEEILKSSAEKIKIEDFSMRLKKLEQRINLPESQNSEGVTEN